MFKCTDFPTSQTDQIIQGSDIDSIVKSFEKILLGNVDINKIASVLLSPNDIDKIALILFKLLINISGQGMHTKYQQIQSILYSNVISDEKLIKIIEKMISLDKDNHQFFQKVIFLPCDKYPYDKLKNILKNMNKDCISFLFRGPNLMQKDMICKILDVDRLVDIFKNMLDKPYNNNSRGHICEMLFARMLSINKNDKFRWEDDGENIANYDEFCKKIQSKAIDIINKLGLKYLLRITPSENELKILSNFEQAKDLYIEIKREYEKTKNVPIYSFVLIVTTSIIGITIDIYN